MADKGKVAKDGEEGEDGDDPQQAITYLSIFLSIYVFVHIKTSKVVTSDWLLDGKR